MHEILNQMPLNNTDSNLDYVVGALIVDENKKIFVHKRSKNRKLFPGCWDIVGGHVEQNETLLQALQREIKEETGWDLEEVSGFIREFHWETVENHTRRKKIEFDFLVKVKGNLIMPQIEKGKHDNWLWINKNELELLKEARTPEDTFIYDTVKKAFEHLESNTKEKDIKPKLYP